MARVKTQQRPNRQEETISAASASALRAMRALDFEVQNEGSEDVTALRAESVLANLALILRSHRYIAEASHCESAAKGIAADLKKSYPTLTPNARGQGPGGLADNPVLLKAFCEMEAESMELDNWKGADPNEEVFEVAREYDKALRSALDEVTRKYPPDNDATAEDLWQAEAPYLVLMSLRGEGVGIWDGDWDGFYEDTEAVEEFLKKKLRSFADNTGGGKLADAFRSAAEESCEDGDDEADRIEDEDED